MILNKNWQFPVFLSVRKTSLINIVNAFFMEDYPEWGGETQQLTMIAVDLVFTSASSLISSSPSTPLLPRLLWQLCSKSSFLSSNLIAKWWSSWWSSLAVNSRGKQKQGSKKQGRRRRKVWVKRKWQQLQLQRDNSKKSFNTTPTR